MAGPPAPPTGVVTFLFSDIEGSTRALQLLGSDADYAQALGESQRLLRAVWDAHGGYEVDTAGDGFFVAFPTASAALAAAAAAQRALARAAWPQDVTLRVRIGIHTGEPQLVGDRYVGLDVHRAARIAATGHGGQILLSQTTRDLAGDALPSGAHLRDLGAYRLKDLLRPERIYQLMLSGLDADFPPLNTLDRHAHNLPVQPTPLIGREALTARIVAALREEGARLVTLTGAGGSGKTRLGLQVAAELLDTYADGVWSVRLARLDDPALVIPTIAATLGLHERGDRDIAEALREWLRSRQILLLLDNFEQVVAAAPDLASALAESAGARALVTSRIPLRLQGEREIAVPPLSLASPPDAEMAAIAEAPAVVLFTQRARACRADFALTPATAPTVAAICARLDGLPLAIELAARRVKLLPPAALLKRLERSLPLLTGGARDLDARQQTMRDALAWSEALLPPAQQVLFRRLGVFSGGWTLEAAEAVCASPAGAEPLALDILDGLGALVDQSLALSREEGGEARLSLLRVIREYALERLEASGELEALRHAHAAYYLTYAERHGEGVYYNRSFDAQVALERERDNLRAAMEWARERENLEMGLRLAAAQSLFWVVSGALNEGATWMRAFLELSARHAADGIEAAGLSARGLSARALVGAVLGNYLRGVGTSDAGTDIGADMLTESLRQARAIGDLGLAAVILSAQAHHAANTGDAALASALVEESVAVARQIQDPFMTMTVLENVSWALTLVKEHERADAYAQEALALANQVGGSVRQSGANSAVAVRRLERDDIAGAREYTNRALRLARETNTWQALWNGLWVAILVVGREGLGERAALLAGAYAASAERVGYRIYQADLKAIDRATHAARAALGEERWATAFAAGRALTLDQAVAEALAEALDETE